MDKKKLLLITNGFPFGNSERGFLSTEYELLEEKFDVYILVRSEMPAPEQWAAVDKSRVFCTGIPAMRVFDVLKQGFRKEVIRECLAAAKGCGIKLLLKRLSAVLRYSARADSFEEIMEKICKEKGIDILYSYWCTQAALTALRVKKKNPSVPLVVRFHGYDLYNERTEENWQPFRRDIAAGADRLVFACENGRDYFLSHWKPEDESKAVVSYLGCGAMERINQKDTDELCIVSCSNLIPLKRVDHIIEAVSVLPDNIPVSWHHFGDGILRAELEEKAAQMFAEKKNVSWTFHGSVPNDTLNRWYDEIGAQLFITTSSTEGGAPVSMQEAFAMGIPAIGTSVGGIPELIEDGVNGYLLSQNPTAEEICDALNRFIGLSARERAEMSAAAYRMWQKKCDARANAERFTEMLRSLKA